MTKLEILEETVAYYSEDISRRGYNEFENMCEYLTPDCKMCAVGRCLENPGELPNGGINSSRLWTIAKFKPEYDGHDPYFWGALQSLHDDLRYWDENGLTSLGEEKVNKLREEFSRDGLKFLVKGEYSAQ